MTTFNHTEHHQATAVRWREPSGSSEHATSWKTALSVAVVAIVCGALLALLISVASSPAPVATHHGGAHGKAQTLFKQRHSGVLTPRYSVVAAGGAAAGTAVSAGRVAYLAHGRGMMGPAARVPVVGGRIVTAGSSPATNGS